MDEASDGSNLIVDLLLDKGDCRKVYLSSWGGLNTVARALLSIEETFGDRSDWLDIKMRVSEKVRYRYIYIYMHKFSH